MMMSQQAYADRIGKTKQYVSKLVHQGKIRKVGRMIDSRQADAAIKAFSRPGRVIRAASSRSSKAKPAKSHRLAPRKPSTRHSRPIAARSVESEVPVASLPSGHRGDATPSLTANRAVREYYEAQQAKIDYEKNVGRLLPADQVLEAERRKNENIRTLFRRMPCSIAPLLAMKSPADVEDILRREIDSILTQLADDPMGMPSKGEALTVVKVADEVPIDVPVMTSPSADPVSEVGL